MNNKASNKIVSLALAAVMALGMFASGPAVTTAYAVEIGVGDGLANPDGSGSTTKYQTVYFGEYNGSPIPWRVLENAGGEALLLSENSLTSMAYKLGSNVWETSTIREYLNDDLFNELPPALQGVIENTDTTIAGANATTDKLYLLSVGEANALSSSDLNISDSWWLRSPGIIDINAAVVYYTGYVDAGGNNVHHPFAIRPTFQIPQTSYIFTSGGDGSYSTPWIVGGTEQQSLTVNGYVQFEIGSTPYKWKVIKIDNGYATLLCTSSVDYKPFDANMNNVWATSDIRAFLNPAAEWAYDANTFAFSGGEKAAIAQADTTVSGQQQTTDRLFLLSQAQAEASAYFPKGYTDRSFSGYWWLRSPGYDDYSAAGVYLNGTVDAAGPSVSDPYAIRPAFKLNLASVIFTSAAAGGKSVTVGDTLSAAEPPTASVKLTVLDSNPSNLNLTCTDTAARTAKSGDTVSITYSGAVTGANKYVSCVIVDDNTGDVLYYGKLSDQANSTASFTVPSGLAEGDYTIKLFNEEVNGNNETDYASTPVNISLTVDSTKPTVTGVSPSGTDVSTTAASLVLTFSEKIDITIAGTVTMSPDKITGGTPDFTSAFLWDASHKVLTIPISGLNYSETYSIVVSGFEDMAGNVIIAESSHSFTTTSSGSGSSGGGGVTSYTVTFDSKEGSAVSKYTGVTYGNTIKIPADPTKSGYTFAGWYKDDTTFNTPWDFTTDKVTSNITLYAKWTSDSSPVPVLNGWVKAGDDYYYYKDGVKVTSSWITTKAGNKYYIGANGKMAKSKWITTKYGNKYYVQANGRMARSKWITTKAGNKYYVQANGRMARSKWITTKYGNQYYVNANGRMTKKK